VRFRHDKAQNIQTISIKAALVVQQKRFDG
jgi:hypothetical protein